MFKKLTKLVLAGAIALGGLGLSGVINPATKAEAAVKSDIEGIYANYFSYGPDSLHTSFWAISNSSGLQDFEYKHKATFVIKNSAGTIVHRGSLNAWQEEVTQPNVNYVHNFSTTTNISTAGLSGGHFRITITIPMDDGSYSAAENFNLTRHFYIDSATRAISQISE